MKKKLNKKPVGRPKGSFKKKEKISDLELKKQIIEREEKNVIVKEKINKVENNLQQTESIIKEVKENISPEKIDDKINEIRNKIEEIKNKTDEKINNFIPKSGEESFDEFLNGFTDVTKEKEAELLKAQEKVEEKLSEEIDEEENEEEEDEEQPRQKRKYTKRNKNVNSSSNYSNDEQAIIDANAMLFNGTMLISLCDFIFPSAIKFVYSKFLKNKSVSKITHTQLVLNSDQLEAISEISDSAARVIFAKVNPIIVFFIGMSVMYFMNFRLALDEQEKIDRLKLESDSQTKK